MKSEALNFAKSHLSAKASVLKSCQYEVSRNGANVHSFTQRVGSDGYVVLTPGSERIVTLAHLEKQVYKTRLKGRRIVVIASSGYNRGFYWTSQPASPTPKDQLAVRLGEGHAAHVGGNRQ
jgi:S-ribosylhomocysteine lyase LuxS involved in autoinducer biosynthesis